MGMQSKLAESDGFQTITAVGMTHTGTPSVRTGPDPDPAPLRVRRQRIEFDRQM